MNPQTLKLIQLVTMISVFGLVASLWIGIMIYLFSRRAAHERKIQQRLGVAGLPEKRSGRRRELRLWVDGKLAQTSVPGRQRIGLGERLGRLRDEAGWEASPTALGLGWTGLTLLGFLGGLASTGSLLIGAAGSLCVMVILWLYTNYRIYQRQDIFERQFVDALGLATRSLRAGHPLTGAFRLIAEEMNPPISRIFAEICQQQELGIGLDEAIAQAAHRSNSTDLKLFATSVIIQLRSGGNLADMMDRLSVVMRERMRLSRRVRVLTAQTQFSKRTLIVMPFVVFVLLRVLNPDYAAKLYTTTIGQGMLGLAIAGLVVGGWVMNRMSVSRY